MWKVRWTISFKGYQTSLSTLRYANGAPPSKLTTWFLLIFFFFFLFFWVRQIAIEVKARGHKSTRTLVLISFIFHTRSNKTWQVIHMIYVGGFTVPIFFFFFGSASLYHFWINWIGFFFGHTQFFFVTNSTWLSNVRKNRHNYTPWIHRNNEILGMRVKKYVDFTTMNWTLGRFLLDLQIKYIWSNQVI